MINSFKKIAFATLSLGGLAGSLTLIREFSTQPMYAGQDFLACLLDLARGHPVVAAVSLDAVVAGVAILIWMIPEAYRLTMRWWLYPALVVTTPLAFAVPLFLFMRERRLDQLARPGDSTPMSGGTTA